MNNQDIPRVNICWPKNNTTTLDRIDRIRGNMSRSLALRKIIEYICTCPDEQITGIIEANYDQADTQS